MRDVEENKVSLSLGDVVDMPIEEFKKYTAFNFNIGTICTCILLLESTYNELVSRKNACLALYARGNDISSKKAVLGLYTEMAKIEEKVVFLKSRKQELVNLDN